MPNALFLYFLRSGDNKGKLPVLFRLLLLFTVIPLTELWLLLWLAGRTSWQFTICLVIFTGVLGAWLARREGLRCLQTIHQRLERGELPTDSLMDGMMILLAGAVLITPGVLTDLLGFLLLIPQFRRLARGWVARRIKARMFVANPSGNWTETKTNDRDHVIDARVIDVESEDP